MNKKLMKKHGINPKRFNRKIEKISAKQNKKEKLLQEVLSIYELKEDYVPNEKVTYEDIIIKEYIELESVINNLNNFYNDSEKSNNIKEQIQRFTEIKNNLIKENKNMHFLEKRLKSKK